MRHVNTRSRRLLALVPAAVLGLAVPVAALSTAATSSAATVRVAAPAESSPGASEPTDGATDGASDNPTDGNGDLCDPGVVPSAPAVPTSAATDTTQSTDGADDPTDNTTDGTDDGSDDTSCDDSHANLVGAVVQAAHARVKAGKAHIPVKVTTARGTALATGKAVLFEGKKRIAVAQVAGGQVTFVAGHLTRGTHRLRVGLVSSSGSVVKAGARLTITVR